MAGMERTMEERSYTATYGGNGANNGQLSVQWRQWTEQWRIDHIVQVVGAIIQSNRWPISGGNYACNGGNGANSVGANSGYDSVGAIIHNNL